MVRPLLPAITDWYEHEFNPIQHEIKVHMVYGNLHVEKDIAESNSQNNDNNPGSVKSDFQVSFHVVANKYENCVTSIFYKKQFQILADQKTLSIFFSREGPPPKSA